MVDDHDILMDGIESILNEDERLAVAGKASSAAIAKELIEKHHPHLIFTDISMGEVSGLELTKFITAEYPLIKVIVLSMHDNEQHISSMLEAGATGYLLKNIKKEELFSAIENVMSGNRYIQQSLAGQYFRACQLRKEGEKESRLSPREIEIIHLIAQGQTTAAISRKLFLSEKTIETHRKNIGRKTGAKTIVSLLNYMKEHGLL